jgi:hypothetical protein
MSLFSRPARLAALAAAALALASCGASGPKGSATTVTSAAATAARAALDQRVADAEAAAKAKPRSERALADLAKAHYLAANADTDPVDSSYRPAGLAHLKRAAQAWERYVALDPKHTDITVASMMALAYGKTGLDEPRQAVLVQLLVAAVRKDSASFQQLAVMAYDAGDKSTGDRAAAKAVKLAPAADRKRLRDGLRALRAGKFPGTR